LSTVKHNAHVDPRAGSLSKEVTHLDEPGVADSAATQIQRRVEEPVHEIDPVARPRLFDLFRDCAQVGASVNKKKDLGRLVVGRDGTEVALFEVREWNAGLL
jgi:hypothetical protein